MGPTTKSISVTGGVTFDQMRDGYQVQAEGLIEGGADILLLETVNDTLNCKAGLVGIERAIAKLGVAPAVAVSGTIETMGTLLSGQDIEAFYTSLAHRDLLWMGLNCATGPDFMTDHLRTLSGHLEILRRVRAQRRPARRRRALQRNARDARGENRALRRKRMGQPGRRMLRHDARAYPPAGRSGRGQDVRASARRSGARSSPESRRWSSTTTRGR